jgi:bifunctional non-homologous end joining protein LigD
MVQKKPDKKNAEKKTAAKNNGAGAGQPAKKALPKKTVANKTENSITKKATAGKTTVSKTATKKASAITAALKTATKKRPPSRVFGNEGRKYEEYIEPMLASLEDKPFDNAEWIFEMKWDGYRAIAEWKKKQLKLYSRNGLSFVQKYAIVADAITKLKHDCVLDGEIVVLNEKGRPRFQMLQEYEQDPRYPIHYYVFDLLFLNGKDVRELPLLNRKELLQKLLSSYKGDIIRYSDHVAGSGKKFFHHVKKLDFEGMMAKKADSEYYSGVRTREWLKIKHHNSQEAVIVGFTAPRRSRKYFGALILGEFKGRRLQYIGHTGTGFSHDKLKALWDLMQPLMTAQSPFAEKIKVNAPVTWIRPELVCEVKFTEQTNEGILRHPVFLGLREDKAAKEVTQNNDR